MIRYNLICEHDHEFESWFDSSSAYDKLEKTGLLECPHCESSSVRKALMAPQISTSRKREASAAARSGNEPGTEMVSSGGANLAEWHGKMVELARQMHDHVKENADYVGREFAEEARKIHHKETDAREIYGEASLDEVKELHEDGIPVLPLPDLPEDKN